MSEQLCDADTVTARYPTCTDRRESVTSITFTVLVTDTEQLPYPYDLRSPGEHE